MLILRTGFGGFQTIWHKLPPPNKRRRDLRALVIWHFVKDLHSEFVFKSNILHMRME